jgi:hypothetical protein
MIRKHAGGMRMRVGFKGEELEELNGKIFFLMKQYFT